MELDDKGFKSLPEPHDLSPQTEIILNSITEGVFTVDLEWRIRFFNRAAEEITGLSSKDALGLPCYEVFRANVCGNACSLPSSRTFRSSFKECVLITPLLESVIV